MEEQVKARLIGATVLVVIVVVLVPELLSGPRRPAEDGAGTAGKRGTRTYTIDLSGGSGEGKVVPLPRTPGDSRANEPRLPAVAPPGTAAVVQDHGQPAAAGPAEPAVATPSKAPTAEPAATPPPVATKPPPTQSAPPVVAKGGWAVQVGAFGSAATARKLVADLQRDGYSAYVAPLARSGKTLHRVRVGPQPNRADADKLASRLKAKGLPASVVAAD